MEKEKRNDLTRGEEEVMQLVWRLGEANINELLDVMPEPKPKYTTVATFIKLLEEKGFVARRPNRRGFSYYPLVEKQEYARRVMSTMLNGYFDGSLVQLVSFFSNDERVSLGEMEEIAAIISEAKKQKQ